ncbi:YjzD family protein [Weizmannia acidilactici]|nr:YjzD family protein [Weizmannia acidilactici]
MKYIFTIFWVFLLTEMLGYVGSAITNSTYHVKTMAIMSLVITAAVLIVNAALPKHVKAEE